MGCSIQKKESNQSQLKMSKEKSLSKLLSNDDQSKQQITNSPPTCSKPPSPQSDSKSLTQQQQIKIQEVIFNKKRNQKLTTLLKCEEQYKFQKTLIGLIKS
ncbi:unnamed protein product [Paramecium pentaurelia]|uniref:Uncharacterized protein n=1 Tax=Paramecium pentaurelia TaxID=43138 RepID=A0A8S1X938_9CILI|nr:unnamed protein product [Paramecium pentaurelia]